VLASFTASGILPEGIHEASWTELVERFGTNLYRKRLLEGLLAGLKALHQAGCERAYVDGSFVTAKTDPGDFDVCYESGSIDFSLLEPILKDFSNRRATQKQKYRVSFSRRKQRLFPMTLFISSSFK
jgi:hypothetical protein